MRSRRDSFNTDSSTDESKQQVHHGWTKEELLEAGGISNKTFDNLRKAARVPGPSHGGLSWVFSADDLLLLIRRAESGTFSERGPAAAVGWRLLMTERGLKGPPNE